MTFVGFNKIPRLSRDCIVTEKIDGTNAQIHIVEVGSHGGLDLEPLVCQQDNLLFFAGSRNRYVTPEKDNFGFATWVRDNAQDLAALGPGRHFGEWYGQGIQRNYGLKERRFALFNVERWETEPRPLCCEVVPVLYEGRFSTESAYMCLEHLQQHGSKAVPGFMNPEGIVILHKASGTLFKKTFDDDPKGKAA